MQIKDRPEFKRKGAVLSFGPDEMVTTAVKVMSEKNYGATVIVSPDGKPVGIVSERDLMRRLLNERRDPDQTRLGDIMTSDVKVAKADDDLLDWLRQMSNDRFRHLPVVDDEGKLISMMSQGDFVSFTWPQLMHRVGEQARATFDVTPSLFMIVGGVIIFLLAVLTIFSVVG
jgi:CBS-domain-containing membrane protein